jgi:hypothetical protein
MLCDRSVGPTDRIPGFAICACCGSRRQLASCHECGLLACGDCRGVRSCAACHRERQARAARVARRARIAEVGRRTALVALVGISGVAGLGAATLPGTMMPSAYAARLDGGRHELRLDQPVTKHTTSALTPWGQPVLLHCYACGDGLACFIIDSQ